MTGAVRDIFVEWKLPVWLTLSMVAAVLIYLRGWMEIRRTRKDQFSGVRLASFVCGVAMLWICVASPMDGFADALLTAHMVEHLLLMSAIPMLLLYGLPVVPLLRGLPKPVLRWIVGPVLRRKTPRRIGAWLTKPLVAWLAMNVAYLAWHIPAAYNLALEDETWHGVEHMCFLATSLLFWWCVMRPWPAEQRWEHWGSLVYLVFSDLVMTMLCGFLAFCDKPVYQYYVEHPNPFHIGVLDDQVLGAMVMWVLGSFAFLIPAMAITLRLVSGGRAPVHGAAEVAAPR